MKKMIDIHGYDYYIISFSGGKDSTATFLWLLDQGVPREKIELWHQEIDGRERTFFDWEITPDYCRAFAKAFGVRIYFQWKVGGFYGELMRRDTLTAPARFELVGGDIAQGGGKTGKQDTRRRFPQCVHSHRTRWCSSYLKIDVCAKAITGQSRFQGVRTLVLTGERAEESEARKEYAEFQPHKADRRSGRKVKRHVDHLRPIKWWTEKEVWQIIERYRVRVHPCYYMGWNRCSCKFCVFGNADQFASAAFLSGDIAREIIRLEKEFGWTIKQNTDLPGLLAQGRTYPHITRRLAQIAISYIYRLPVIVPENQTWLLPAGAKI